MAEMIVARSAIASHEWAKEKRPEIFGRAGAAIMNAVQSHVEDRSAKQAAAGTAGAAESEPETEVVS